MRLAFSTLAAPGWTIEEMADAARRCGFDGIEWRLADGALLGPRTDDAIWARIADCGLPSVCLDTSCVFVRATPEEREKTIRAAIRMAEHAAGIGAPCIRVFGGAAPDGIAPGDLVGPARDALAEVVAAIPSGVRVLVETHDAWSTGASVAELVRGTDAGVLWDIAHTVRAGETPDETLDLIGVPGLVHVKDATGADLTHLGDGDIPLGAAARALRTKGYDGWLSFEWEKLWHPELDEPDAALPRAADTMRALAGR